jgi:hypothetical protein
MLTFIKILCKIIFYCKNRVFCYFKLVLYTRTICIRNQIRVFDVRYCGHLWVLMLNCLKCLYVCVGSIDV